MRAADVASPLVADDSPERQRRGDERRRARYEPTFDTLTKMLSELHLVAGGRSGTRSAEARRFIGIVEHAQTELRSAIRAGAVEEAELFATIERSWADIDAELQVLPPESVESSGLSPRELEILKALAEGLANKQIAFGLGISSRTVRNHVSSIYVKLGVSARAEAAVHAVRMRLL